MTESPTSEEERHLSNALQSWLPAFPVTDEEVEEIEAQIEAERAGDGDQNIDRVSARSMVRGLEAALRERSHPFPAFASRIMALRMSSHNQEALESRFEIPLDLWHEFESGRIHPAWFSRAATMSGARTLPPIEAWHHAIRDAYHAVRPEERAPDATVLSRLVDPWVEYLDDLLRGDEEEATAAADAIEQTEFSRQDFGVGDRVRSRAHKETGVVLRRIAEDLYEVSLPQGTFMIPAPDLEGLEASVVELMVRKQTGRSSVFASFLQSQYLHHAYRYDELASLNNARVEPKPHQVFVAWRVLNKVRPRMILADEVGLGKTIEAGIILKELAARQLVTRVLIVVPANLVGQWVWEMKSKFNIDLEVYDGRRVRELRQRYQDRNIWEVHDQVICSLPFASRDSVAKEIAEAEWDMVVFDEAHRVRKRRQRTTKAYNLADELRFGAYGMLLLTATPMQLDSSELFATIELVEPGLFPGGIEQFNAERRKVRDLNELMLLLNDYEGLPEVSRVARSRQHIDYLRNLLELSNPTPELIAERLGDENVRQSLEQRLIELHPLARVMVRNRKREVPEAFARRKARSKPVPLSLEEAAIYERVEAYVREGFNRAKEDKNMAVGFLMVTFMKMLTSSSHSLARSFERRVKKLQADLAQAPQEAPPVREPALVGGGSPASSKGWARWDSPNVVELREAAEQSEAVDLALEAITREAATRIEVDELRELVSALDATPDTKLTVLSQFLEGIFAENLDEKVLIFTQFIETQLFLKEHLSSLYSVQIFNGRQSAEQKDQAVKRFRERDQILISTEAGGEGRNFQFAHIVVNYDLPWNPMKIEQRIGRVDRIGQKRDVLVQNFFLQHPDPDRSTLDERVFEVLQERINVFEESIGSLDPILGDVEEEIRRVALEAEPEEVEAEFRSLSENIEAQMKQARQMEKRLRDFVMDKNSYRWDKARELMDQEKALATWRDLERFVSQFLQFHGGSVDEHSEGGQVVTIPLKFAHELRTRHSRQRGTFDPDRALSFEELDFFAIGHPLIDRMLDFAAGRTGEATVTAYEEYTRGSEGWAVELFYRVRATGVRPREAFVRHRVRDGSLAVSNRITSMPDAGADVRREDIPLTSTEITDAVRVSEEAIVAAQATMQRDMEARNAGQRAEEIERAQRIYQYRRQKEQQTIDEQKQRLSDYEYAGTPDERRLIPAIRGRIEKARQRLEVVELDHARELQEIEERSRVAVSYELLCGALVWLRPR